MGASFSSLEKWRVGTVLYVFVFSGTSVDSKEVVATVHFPYLRLATENLSPKGSSSARELSVAVDATSVDLCNEVPTSTGSTLVLCGPLLDTELSVAVDSSVGFLDRIMLSGFPLVMVGGVAASAS